MIADTIKEHELFSSLDKIWKEFVELVISIDEKEINKVPFVDSWTAAQLATHVKKSNKAIVQGLQMQGKPGERPADERAEELKNTFLDFDAKFQSPDFLVPEKKYYNKDDVSKQLENSIHELTRLRSEVNLTHIINLPIFGEITKLEILYFVLYHTQRHTRQLKNILYMLSNKN